MIRLLACVTGLGMVLACGGGGGTPTCEAFVEYNGKSFQGSGRGATAAADNACYRYCATADPEFAAFFGVYADSPQGKRFKGKDRLDVMLSGNKTLKPHFEKCVTRCMGDAPTGRNGLSITSDCP